MHLLSCNLEPKKKLSMMIISSIKYTTLQFFIHFYMGQKIGI
jgi:hypothetical protein